jgi:hypothetical protein
MLVLATAYWLKFEVVDAEAEQRAAVQHVVNYLALHLVEAVVQVLVLVVHVAFALGTCYLATVEWRVDSGDWWAGQGETENANQSRNMTSWH